ncbi:hypothetical protein BD560DRAFT_91500 [Blakeslea trispora]|nr:hypothetical protein BD560DRAFT_91500 [Blakeslea trispora]
MDLIKGKDETTTKIIEYKPTKTITSTTKPSKRGYKTHVPSACVNCKIAHLACDVSRPCKRCIALNKTETCQDMQHKKRGRPKLKEKTVQLNDPTFEIMYGTIQTPALFMKQTSTLQIPPFQAKVPTPEKSTPSISFVHESFESKQDSLSPKTLSPTTLSSPTTSTSSFTFSQKPWIDPQVTAILSMEACCAKTSNEVIQYWGYYPQELAHRSFYDFVSPKDTDRLAKLHQLLIQQTQLTTPAERTTSVLFNQTDQQTLCCMAPGSRSFSDTIHVKLKSGDCELYDVVVYIGGGLGADLYQTSTLSKQYIVAQFRQHDYEVLPPSRDPPKPKIKKPSDKRLSFIQKFAPSAVQTSQSPYTVPKLNIAPITSLKNSHDPTLLFQQLTSHTPTSPSSAILSSPTCVRNQTGMTHPTQQYFLQTSSSTLNAAASAAQMTSRQAVVSVSSTAEPTVVPNRKVEMSIRSLLC